MDHSLSALVVRVSRGGATFVHTCAKVLAGTHMSIHTNMQPRVQCQVSFSVALHFC